MVYNFFSRWKETQEGVVSIKEELEQIENFYRYKIILFKRIWDSLDKRKIDEKSSKQLLELYKRPDLLAVYDLVIKQIREMRKNKTVEKEQLSTFHDLIYKLQLNAEEEKEIAISLLKELVAGRLPEKGKFYELQEMLKEESVYLRIEDKKFNKIEEVFLIKNDPGSGTGGYVQIVEAVKKGIIYLRGNLFYFHDKPLQGIKLQHNLLIIKGDHYAPLQNAKWIEGDAFVSPSIQDPYSYFVERGKFGGWKKNRIQRALGVPNAEAVVALEIEVFPEQLYIKCKKGVPTKFAIVHLQPRQVIKVIKKVRAVA